MIRPQISMIFGNKERDLYDWVIETAAEEDRTISGFLRRLLKQERERRAT